MSTFVSLAAIGCALERAGDYESEDDSASEPSLEDAVAFGDEVDHDEDEECPNCGGEGFVWDCIDGMCLDAELGCDLCERLCDWCNP